MKEVKLVTEKSTEKKCSWCTIGIIVGVVLLIAAAAIAIYKYLTPDYLDDFDEFDDDFDDDFFEDETEIAEEAAPEAAPET